MSKRKIHISKWPRLEVRVIWLWHLSPRWSLGLIWLIWLMRHVSLPSLITPCASLQRLWAWSKRMTIPDRGGPVFGQAYISSCTPLLECGNKPSKWPRLRLGFLLPPNLKQWPRIKASISLKYLIIFISKKGKVELFWVLLPEEQWVLLNTSLTVDVPSVLPDPGIEGLNPCLWDF